jgi:hypothetical protein
MFAALWATISLSAWAGTPGAFRGTIIPPPSGEAEPAEPEWLYVQGPNHLVRRVALDTATVVYGEEVPYNQRHGHPKLTEGAEVRVTAEQDAEGEWHALRIEVIRVAPPPAAAANRKKT